MARKPAPASGPRARVYVVIFLAFVTTILVVGRSTYTAQQRQFDLDLRQRIDQVADLKAKQVAAWRTERLGDAAVAVAGTLLMPAVPDVMRGASTPAAAEQLRAWLDAIRIQYQYEHIVLVDTTGRIRLSAGELLASPARYAALATDVLKSDRILFRDVPAARHRVSRVTDLVMPDRERIEMIQEIRRRFPTVKTVAMSGATDGPYLRAAELLGASATLSKPLNSSLLRLTLQQVLTVAP